MEIWDGYRIDGTPAGQQLRRGEPIPEGLYHLVSEILVRHEDGTYLLMGRDPRKTHFGGYYEATAGGAALAGETIVQCARRELWEETGIEAQELTQVGRYVSRNTIYHMFLCITHSDKTAVKLQEGETVDYQWVSEQAFREFVNSDRMIPGQKERFRDFFKQMGYV